MSQTTPADVRARLIDAVQHQSVNSDTNLLTTTNKVLFDSQYGLYIRKLNVAIFERDMAT
jgi:hypothetical protein